MTRNSSGSIRASRVGRGALAPAAARHCELDVDFSKRPGPTTRAHLEAIHPTCSSVFLSAALEVCVPPCVTAGSRLKGVRNLLLLAWLLAGRWVPAADLTADFSEVIRPLLQRHCLGCHSTEKHKGDLDLERAASAPEIRRHPGIWEGVIEQVGSGEMPPKDEPPMPVADRTQLLQWANRLLDEIAKERAGDPGPVVLRRLSNAEYTYSLRDLTGLEALDPAREFPADSAAGEGFMNVGSALVMSPALLTKYLDAARDVTRHAAPVPDGIRFFQGGTRRDWTEEILASIRAFYSRYTVNGGGTAVNLQGIRFDTRDGGVLPLDRYLAASLETRGHPNDAAEVATRHGLSARYLSGLLGVLEDATPSWLLDPLRARWRAAAPGDTAAVAALVADVEAWQRVLWRFNPVGHIGKVGGPPSWMDPVTPLAPRRDFRMRLAVPTNGSNLVFYLVTSDAGDGPSGDWVQWQDARIEFPDRPPLALRDIRSAVPALQARRERLLRTTAACLAAVAEAMDAPQVADVAGLARSHAVEPEDLAAWFEYLGIGSVAAVAPLELMTNALRSIGGHDFVSGWGAPETPNLAANASDQAVRIPGNLKPRGVTVHPSPGRLVAVGWRSPTNGLMHIAARVTHTHPECGNGVTWTLELRRGATRQRLAAGVAQGGTPVATGSIAAAVRAGDLVSVLVGPRDGNHSCDLTDVELSLRTGGPEPIEWNLNQDVASDILAANPHADSLGNPGVWSFYTAAVSGSDSGPVIPSGSLLARWLAADTASGRKALARSLQSLLTSETAAGDAGTPSQDPQDPDALLRRQLVSLGGPLLRGTWSAGGASETASAGSWGLEPALFGRHPAGGVTTPGSLCVAAPSVLEVRLPADLVAGGDWVVSAVPDPVSGTHGSTQVEVLFERPADPSALKPGIPATTPAPAVWTDARMPAHSSSPILVAEGSPARARIEAGLDAFRQWFPAAVCYTKIVPVDEVVTLTLFHREDEPFSRLLLDDAERRQLDRLWSELRFVSQDALTLVDAFEQLWQYATQDADPKVFEPMRQPILDRAAAFRKQVLDAEPVQLDAAVALAGRAYRRPLRDSETAELRSLYANLRGQEIPHDEALRLVLARMWTSPAFLYRIEASPAGVESGPVSDWELATRLSYFLWSSVPDEELRSTAAAGRLGDPGVLAAQARRMLRDPRVRRLAIEFACAWLHIHGFDELDEKSERHFPTFAAVRGAMYEEAIRFFTDAIQNDAPIPEWFDADHSFLNAALAGHYDIPGVTGEEWQRVSGLRARGRGGILGLGATLSKQSGASRTSPILRGNWVSEVLLGERLPRPPKDVPRLPEDESTEALTVRQLTEKHSSDPRCAGCHVRIDGFGFALEGFDAVGRLRGQDLGGRPVETRARLPDGTEVEGAVGLRRYLMTRKRDAVMRQFHRKLLGYALGRSVILSDKPLLASMAAAAKGGDDRFSSAVETIVRSRQFREIRGRDAE